MNPQKALVDLSSRAGGKTPNFRGIVKAGGVLPDQSLTREIIRAPNFCLATLERLVRSPDGSWIRYQRYVDQANQYVPTVPRNPWTDSELASRLIQKAKSTQWSLPVFLGELSETAGMVGKGAIRLTKMVMYLRKGKFRDFVNLFHPSSKQLSQRQLKRSIRNYNKDYGRDPASAVRGAWLQYQYGWKPFVKDIYDAFETLSELQDKEASKIGRVYTRLRHNEISNIVSPDRATSLAGIPCGGTWRTTWNLSGSAIWRFRPRELNTLGKLGLTNPLSVAWELSTLSFVVDWFIPIGDYLDALDAPLRFEHVGGAYGFKAVGDTFASDIRPQGDWTIDTSVPWSVGVKRVFVRRRPMSGVPTPKLADLSFRANLGLSQAISAMALLTQAISGLSK